MNHDLKIARKLRKEYEDDFVSTIKLSEKYGIYPAIVVSLICRAGGKIRTPKECHRMFNLEQSEKIRKEYEGADRLSCIRLADKYGCSLTAISHAIKYAGGKIRPKTEHRRLYFRSPKRERSLFCGYNLKSEDMDWLWARQKGLCSWCSAPLPKDSLVCFVDHIDRGYRKGLSNRKNVRGLCCPDNVCNQFAGRIERNNITKKDWGLLSSYVDHIKMVIKLNRGNLPFPRAQS